MYRAAYYGLTKKSFDDAAAPEVEDADEVASSLTEDNGDVASEKLVMVGSAIAAKGRFRRGESTPEEVESVIDESSLIARRRTGKNKRRKAFNDTRIRDGHE